MHVSRMRDVIKLGRMMLVNLLLKAKKLKLSDIPQGFKGELFPSLRKAIEGMPRGTLLSEALMRMVLQPLPEINKLAHVPGDTLWFAIFRGEIM